MKKTKGENPQLKGKQPRDGAGLGIYGKTVDQIEAKSATRLARHAAKRTAANLLRGHDDMLAGRVSKCGMVAWQPDVTLARKTYANGEAVGALHGLTSCKSVWACPICSARISAKRRDEMNDLLAWARAEGHGLAMLTLTARHSKRTALVPFLSALKAASKRLRQSKGWRGLRVVGSVTATEVTHGANGWHPHLHLLLVLPAETGDASATVERCRTAWLSALAREGLDGNAAAFQVQNADNAGEYVAKFGAAEEIALGHAKQGRDGSRSPWQLLADARDGDAQAARLWITFALAFKGRRQLQWSPGLKAAAGIGDDEENDEGETSTANLRSWGGKSDEWRHARRRRCALLDAAEKPDGPDGHALDAAEFGPTDATRWRREKDAGEVLDEGDTASAQKATKTGKAANGGEAQQNGTAQGDGPKKAGGQTVGPRGHRATRDAICGPARGQVGSLAGLPAERVKIGAHEPP